MLDKYEYRIRTEQMMDYYERGSYKEAMDVADSIDWRKAKNVPMLCTASEIYEYNGEYEKSRELLFIAYDRAPSSRKIVYRLGILGLKLGDVQEAMDCYEEFRAMAPKDPNQYILHYKILRSQKAPLNQQIEALETFKKAEYVEKWAYELAKLYEQAGMIDECLEECDDLILWFSEGKYVYQAMELKMQYKPLTPMQQETYLHRNDPPKSMFAAPELQEAEEHTEEEAPEEAPEAEVIEEVEETLEESPEAEVTEVVEEAVEEAPETEATEAVEEAPETEATEAVEEAPEEEPIEEIEEIEEETKEDDLAEQPTKEFLVEEIKAALAAKEATDLKAAKVLEQVVAMEEESAPVEEEVVEEPAPVEEEVVEKPAPVEEEVVEEPAPVEEEVVEEPAPVEEEVVEEPAPVEEEVVEEPAPVEEEVVVEEPVAVEEVTEELKEMNDTEASKMSVEEILQDWEEKQKENAQLIQEEQEKARLEREAAEAEAQKHNDMDSILPDDIRQLMEELEAEAAEIQSSKIQVAEPAPVVEEVVEAPVAEPQVEEAAVAEETVVLEKEPVEIPEALKQVIEEDEYEEDPFDEDSFDEETFEQASSETFEEIEEVEDIEDSDGIKLGDTQAIAISAKALMNDTVVDIPEKPQEKYYTKESSPFDTGYIVQGRYDLEAQSEIGIKAGLTEEQKKIFSYFVPVHGMSEQIVDVLEHDKNCRTRYGTSRTANILVVGRKGSGKTVLAVDIVKAIQKNRKLKQGKVGIVTAESLNKKNVAHILEKLHGGALIIERASKLNKKTVAELNDLMEEQTGEMLVVLEEERRPLDKMLASYPVFKKKFTSRLELPVFINDELVTFAQTYAKENGYKIDDLGILALYSRIDLLQREEAIVTVADVKEIIDAAIQHAQKWTLKKFFMKLFRRHQDETSRILLQEQDFK